MLGSLAFELWDLVFGTQIRKEKERKENKKNKTIKQQSKKLEQSKMYIDYLKAKRERTEKRIAELQKKLAMESTARIVEREMGVDPIDPYPFD